MKYKLDPVLVKTFIVMLIVINVVYFIRVGFDILGTGIIMKETSPDGQHEVVVSKEKYQGIFLGFADDVSTFELYEKKSGKLISHFENEIRIFGQSF